MTALDIPLLLVVGGYLGTISHTLTALDVLAQRKLTIAAIVVSESERDAVELDDTVASIARFAGAVGVVGLPRLPAGISHHPAIARIAVLALSAVRPLHLSQPFELNTVSIMPSRLTNACISMVKMVDPLAQRIHPNSTPNAKTWAMRNQSY